MQIILNGLINGISIATLALAFNVVNVPTRVFWITLGAIYTTASYVAWALIQSGWSIVIACGIATLASMLIAILCEIFNHRPLAKKGASEGVQMISSLGLYVVIINIIVLVWGNDTKTWRGGVDRVWHPRQHGFVERADTNLSLLYCVPCIVFHLVDENKYWITVSSLI